MSIPVWPLPLPPERYDRAQQVRWMVSHRWTFALIAVFFGATKEQVAQWYYGERRQLPKGERTHVPKEERF